MLLRKYQIKIGDIKNIDNKLKGINMNIKQLKYFLVVAEERQITFAAKKLYIAQPPLSYQLKQLEKEVGVQLFVRTAHGIELTEEGKVFQKYAEKIVSLSISAQS